MLVVTKRKKKKTRRKRRRKKSQSIPGETELEDEFDYCTDTLWIDMPMVSRIFHVIKQVLQLYPIPNTLYVLNNIYF